MILFRTKQSDGNHVEATSIEPTEACSTEVHFSCGHVLLVSRDTADRMSRRGDVVKVVPFKPLLPLDIYCEREQLQLRQNIEALLPDGAGPDERNAAYEKFIEKFWRSHDTSYERVTRAITRSTGELRDSLRGILDSYHDYKNFFLVYVSRKRQEGLLTCVRGYSGQ